MVHIYCDYDGVINPISKSTYGKNTWDSNQYINYDDLYTIDCQHADLRWSHELACDLATICTSDDVEWIWLTSNQPWMQQIVHQLNKSIGDSSMRLPYDTYPWPQADQPSLSKLDVIKFEIRRLSEMRGHHKLVWIDDDYYPLDRDYLAQLNELPDSQCVPTLKMTPMCQYGLRRSEVEQLRQFCSES